MFLLPLLPHFLEAGVHYLRSTPHLKTSIIASVCFTIISTLFKFLRHAPQYFRDAWRSWSKIALVCFLKISETFIQQAKPSHQVFTRAVRRQVVWAQRLLASWAEVGGYTA